MLVLSAGKLCSLWKRWWEFYERNGSSDMYACNLFGEVGDRMDIFFLKLESGNSRNSFVEVMYRCSHVFWGVLRKT